MSNIHQYTALRASPSLVASISSSLVRDPGRVPFHFISYENERQIIASPTIKALHDQALDLALGLKALGLNKGDRVLILSDQSKMDVVGILGCLYAGMISCTIPPPIDLAKQQRFSSVLASSEAKVIVCNQLIKSLLIKSALTTPIQTIAEISSSAAPDQAFTPANEDVVYLQYTSGSTNAPKGVVVSQRNVLDAVALSGENPKELQYESFVSWAPFFHNVGLLSLFAPLLVDCLGVILRPIDFMQSPRRWLEVISQFKVEGTFGPNSAYNLLTKVVQRHELEGLSLQSLKVALNGSEPLDYQSLQNFHDKFREVGFRLEAFVSGYGLAETTSGLIRTSKVIEPIVVEGQAMLQGVLRETSAKTPGAKTIIPVGDISPYNKVAIVHPETGKRLGDSDIGEIWIQSSLVALGYWKNPKATADTFQGVLDGEDGFWLRTGDFGTLHRGDLFVTGRMKEVMIVNGHNFYPADIVELIRMNVPVLSNSPMTSFSIDVQGKERIICAIEYTHSDSEALSLLADKVSQVISKTYEFYPFDIIFALEGSLPRTDNGKLQTLKIKSLYVNENLQFRFSMKQAAVSDGGLDDAPKGTIELMISGLFSEVLEVKTLGANESFFKLGGDSISIARVASRIKDVLAVDIPIKYLLDNPTIRNISKIIRNYQVNRNFDGLQITGQQLKDECVLDEAIVPPPYEANFDGPKSIFLTGATGFVGAYLLKDLMMLTSAKVTCLVRARDKAQGLKRIQENMASYNLWDDSFRERIAIAIGDLADAGLGMSTEEFDRIAADVDTIYHNGAFLNFVYPYQRLKEINVTGTAECLRLACHKRAKYFHHVSSFSVYDNPSYFGREVTEDDILEDPTGYFLGYTETKWVAEKLVQIAASRGLRTAVYRPGEISGASDSGIWKLSDAVIRSLIASIQVKAMPDVAMRFHLTPVNYVSKAIVTLSLQQRSLGHAFNLLNKNTLTHSELSALLNELGAEVQLLSFDQWRDRVFSSPDDNALKPLETLMYEERPGDESMQQRYGSREATFAVTNTLKGLEGTGVSCAPVDLTLLSTYFTYFKQAGYIS